MKQQKNKDASSYALCQTVIKGMLEKKAKEIVVLDLQNVKNAVADFFVISTGTSDTHISAIADSVIDEVKKSHNTEGIHSEGMTHREWVLVDYLDVVVHIFNKERRAFYDLESLWGDAVRIEVSEETAYLFL
jgi:ribosome-associated protein